MVRSLTLVFVSAGLLAVFAASAGGHPLCDCTSSVWAGDYFPCTGDTVEIFAHVQDCYCTPLVGKSVAFYSTRGTDDQILEATALTDANGVAKTHITTSVPGASRIYAVVFGIQVGPTPPINWSGASSVDASTWGQIKALFK